MKKIATGRTMSLSRKAHTRRGLAEANSNESGQELVEGAFVLLIVFVFIFAIFEGGRLLQVRQALTDAAREGARRSVAPLTQTTILATVPDVRNVVKGYLGAASIQVADPDIDVEQSVVLGGSNTVYTRVTVRYVYHSTTLSIFGLNNLNLSGKSLMRNETSP